MQLLFYCGCYCFAIYQIVFFNSWRPVIQIYRLISVCSNNCDNGALKSVFKRVLLLPDQNYSSVHISNVSFVMDFTGNFCFRFPKWFRKSACHPAMPLCMYFLRILRDIRGHQMYVSDNC